MECYKTFIESAMMKFLLSFFLLLMLVTPSHAMDLNRYIDNPKVVGQARLKVLFWDVYDAKLIANDGTYESNKPFALSLTYLRKFSGDDIASRSVDEIRQLGMNDEMKLAKWYQTMSQLFPDVAKGESITGIVDNNKVSHFYYNDQRLGSVDDPEFSIWFFNIWLSSETSEPDMRAELIGKL